MKDNTERDVKRSIDRLSTLSSEASSHTFKSVDKIAKKASDFIENRSIEQTLAEKEKEVESRLKTSEYVQENNTETDLSTEGNNDSTSKLKTNVNNDTSSTTNSQEEKDVEAKDSDKDIPKKSKLKTVVEKTNKKIFKFNDNQGKVSKVATTVSKGGEKLSKAGIEYTVDPTIVRGLDYYTKTVFEFVTDCIGAQGTVCGGGRYDGLIEELGGKHLPSLGFAMGMERLLMVMDKQGIEIPDNDECMLYIATMGDAAKVKAFELIKQVRSCGMIAETDVIGRGLRAQMKYADKIDARYSIVLGDNEIEQNTAKVKNMETGETAEVTLDGHFMEKFIEIQLSDEQKNK